MREEKPRGRFGTVLGVVLTAAWLLFAAAYVDRLLGFANISALLPHEQAGLLSGALLPPFLLWSILLYLYRRRMIARETEVLLEKLDQLTYPGAEAEDRVQTISINLRNQAQTLRDTAEEVTEKLGGLHELFQKETQKLVGAGVRAASLAERLEESLADKSKQLSAASREVGEQLDASRTSTEEQLDKLSQAMKESRDVAQELSTALESPIEVFQEVRRSLQDESKELVGFLRDDAEAFGQARDQLSITLGDIRASLTEGGETLSQSGARTIERSRAMADDLREVLAKLTTSLDGGVERLDYLRATMENQGNDLNEIAAGSEARAKEINAAMQAIIGELQENFSSAQDRAQDVVSTYRAESDLLIAAAEKVSSRLTEEFASNQERIHDFGRDLATAARDASALVESELAKQDEIASGLAVRISETAKDMGEKIESLSQSAREDLLAGAKETMALIQEEIAQNRAEVEDYAQKLAAQSDEAANKLMETFQALRRELQGSETQLANSSEAAVARLSERFAQHEAAILDLEKSLSVRGDQVSGKVTESFEAAEVSMGNSLSSLRVALDAWVQGLEAAVDTGRRDLEESGKALREEVESAVVTVQQRLQEAVEALRPQIQNLSASVDRVEEKAEVALDRLDKHSHAMSDLGDRSSEVIARTSKAYREAAREFAQEVAEAVAQAEQANNSLKQQQQALIAAGNQAGRSAKTLHESLGTEVSTTRELAELLEGLTERVKITLEEEGLATAEAAKLAMETTQGLRSEMQNQAEELRSAVAILDDRMSQISELVGSRVEVLDGAAQAALERGQLLSTTMAEQTQRFAEQMRAMTEGVEGLSLAARKQSQELSTATEEAKEQTIKLKQSDLESRRDIFLRTATVMLEDLSAGSVDLARLFGEDLPAEELKRWKEGDRSVFARRLLKRRDRGELANAVIAERFSQDPTFRHQAMRYITQFETLMNHAAACDPENVLTATFLTADVGKLYLLLNRSIGKDR